MDPKAAKHIYKKVCKTVKYTVCILISTRYTISKTNNNKRGLNLFFYKEQIFFFYYIVLLKYIVTEPC